MKIIESSEEKVNKVIESLDKEKDKKADMHVPFWLYKKETARLELSNRRLCKLAFIGWGFFILYALIDIVSKVIVKN